MCTVCRCSKDWSCLGVKSLATKTEILFFIFKLLFGKTLITDIIHCELSKWVNEAELIDVGVYVWSGTVFDVGLTSPISSDFIVLLLWCQFQVLLAAVRLMGQGRVWVGSDIIGMGVESDWNQQHYVLYNYNNYKYTTTRNNKYTSEPFKNLYF